MKKVCFKNIRNGCAFIRFVYLVIFNIFFTSIYCHAQTYVPNGTSLNTPNTSGEFYSDKQVNMVPPFSASGANGTFHAYIASPDCMPFANNLSSNYNYILTTMPRASFTSASQFSGQGTCQLMQSVQYFDGLGRPVQTIQIKGSPLSNDMVSPAVYDMFGRPQVNYLPYTITSPAVNDGSYKPTALISNSGQASFYASPPSGVKSSVSPYAVTGFEMSPEGRVVEQGAPGSTWQIGPGQGDAGSSNHSLRKVYVQNDIVSTFSSTYTQGVANPGSRIAALYTATINNDETRTLARTGNNAVYGATQLDVVISKDENWQPTDGCIGTVEEYRDKEGHIVLKRTYNLNTVTKTVEMLSTYYVYDDFGQLCFVLTPQVSPDANATITQALIDNLCFQYRYDWKQRLTQKKLPGKGWEFMVYNPIDQVILTQDANQRSVAPQVMSLIKYDGQGRAITTGQYLVTGSSADVNVSSPSQTYRQSLESTYQDTNNQLWESKSASTTTGYTNNAGPAINGNNTYTINYYDDYTAPNLPSQYAAGNGAVINQSRGLATASKTMVLNTLGSTTPDMLWAVHYYDALGRMVQGYQQHYLGGSVALSTNNYDAISSSYDFTNEVTATIRNHYNTTSTTTAVVTVANTYSYDHMGRKTQTFEQINGGTNTLLSQLSYNEIGQLNQKQLHSEDAGSTFLQAINYTYNERGWLLQSSAPLFEEQLQYDDISKVSSITPIPQFNGNIASQSWGTSGLQNSKSYVYLYDRLNRLVKGSSPTTGFNYQEKSIAYDLAGNLRGLQRYWNAILIDQLAYKYNDAGGNYSNQLMAVTDTSTDASANGFKAGTYAFAYDFNGNLITDNSRGITGTTGITYNLLNLPQTISSKSTTYTYDATGKKLRRLIGSATTDYINGIEYDNGVIVFFQTEEGRVFNSSGSYTNYEYTLNDHLGNSRVSFDRTGGGSIAKQIDNYLPFGLDIPGNVSGSPNKYLYNKKELQDGLTMYDYGARFYDPVIGRWNAIDPLAEISRRWSPYNYVENDPVRLTDPDGMETQTHEQIQETEARMAEERAVIEDGKAGIVHPISGAGNRQGKSNGNPPAWKKILAWFGIGTSSPRSNEEAISNAEGHGRLEKLDKYVNQVNSNLDNSFGYVPFLSGAYGVSQGLVNHNKLQASLGMASGMFDAFGGEIVETGGRLFKPLTELGLTDGMKLSSTKILELGEEFLGKGYSEAIPGSGRYVSADGSRVLRIGESDITGAHGGGPHANFETLIPNPAKPGKLMVDKNLHIYISH